MDFLLLHGHHLGTWCWDGLRERLEAAGHGVHTPPFHGMGERIGELDASSGLERHVHDTAAFIESRNLRDLIIVGHSYAGLVACGLAHTSGARIHRVIFLDAAHATHGQRLFDLLPGLEPVIRAAAEASGGLSVRRTLSLEAFGLERSAEQAPWASRLTEVPFRCFEDSLYAPGDPVDDCHPHYIWCARCELSAATAARCRARPGWTYEEIDADHLPMITAPALLSEALWRAAAAHPLRP